MIGVLILNLALLGPFQLILECSWVEHKLDI